MPPPTKVRFIGGDGPGVARWLKPALASCILAASILIPLPALAAGEPDAAAAELAKKLSNPLAALISVPFQYNFDSAYGVNEDGRKGVVNIQPVIPVTLNPEWNLISRTILPVVTGQENIPAPGTEKSGLGDVVQSVFFSPAKPTGGGWIWGAGPVLLLPTAGNDLLGAGKWGVGPTAVALKQANGWTLGLLVNHLWSFAGDAQRKDLSASIAQPFVGFSTKTLTTFTLNTETTYDWKAKQWTVPINFMVAQLLRVGGRPVQVQLGARYWAQSVDMGPHGWGGASRFHWSSLSDGGHSEARRPPGTTALRLGHKFLPHGGKHQGGG